MKNNLNASQIWSDCQKECQNLVNQKYIYYITYDHVTSYLNYEAVQSNKAKLTPAWCVMREKHE